MNQPLVSVCAPFYNVAPFSARFFDSLLSQTYDNLELILVNDGSTDNTDDVIKSYIPQLEERGYKVRYIVQENAGLPGAINRALKEVNGVYLIWPDPDDWITPDSIMCRVRFLESHPHVAFVRGSVELIREKDQVSEGYAYARVEHPCRMENFFEELLNDKTYTMPVANMIRMSCLLEQYPAREIYVHRKGGQNYQLMFPIAARYECWQIPELVGYYSVRDNSHSHINDYNYRKELISAYEKTALATLSIIPEMERKYVLPLKRRYADVRLNMALSANNKNDARKAFREMRKMKMLSWRAKLGLFVRLYLRRTINGR